MRDLGGVDNTSAAERALAESFQRLHVAELLALADVAASAVPTSSAGFAALSRIVSVKATVARTLGTKRRPKDAGKMPWEWLEDDDGTSEGSVGGDDA